MQQAHRPALIAGVALAGASLIAMNPAVPGVSSVHRVPLELTAGTDGVATDWGTVMSTAETNLQMLFGAAQKANASLMSAVSTEFSGSGDLITNSLNGVGTGLQNSLDGGWHGGDDGYVFGLFGGTVTDPATGVSETGSTLQEIMTALQHGSIMNAYGYFDAWSLETLDHTLKPLLSPILSVTSHGVTTEALPGEMLQTLTNVVNEFFTYANLKSLGDAVMAPQISAAFGLSSDLDAVGTALSSGGFGTAMTDLVNMPASVIGDLLNGYDLGTNPYNGSDETFTGLLNTGSLLDDLLVTWPTMLATALDG